MHRIHTHGKHVVEDVISYVCIVHLFLTEHRRFRHTEHRIVFKHLIRTVGTASYNGASENKPSVIFEYCSIHWNWRIAHPTQTRVLWCVILVVSKQTVRDK